MSKYWVVGFTEAEGSFYLTKKGPFRISHCFEITQKNDKIVSLLTNEQGLYDLLGEVQKAYTKPINDLYEDLRN